MVTWLAVPGWEGFYEVSDAGEVRSLRDNHGTGRLRTVRPNPVATRYLRVTLSRPGRKQNVRLHKLVLLAFRGPPPTPAHEGAHANGDAHDCRLENLRWATRTENEYDKKAHGRALYGERHHQAKLTIEAVRELRQLRAAGWSALALGRRFGISNVAANNAATRRTWKHVA